MDDKTAENIRGQVYFWLVMFFAFLVFVWVFSDILLPFVAGMALAYFLDPVADRLEKTGVSRIAATSIILIVFIIGFVTVLVVLVPILAIQINGFLERLPILISELQALIASERVAWIRDLIGSEENALRDNLNMLMREGVGWVSAVLQQVWASGKSLINVISLLIVTPVVAFYLLYDWDHMVERIDGWLPVEHRVTIRGIFYDIDNAVAGFVRGQGTVCLILALFYAISLSLIGVNFGLLIGLFAGLISFIPFVGSIVGFVISVGVALVQFWPEYDPAPGNGGASVFLLAFMPVFLTAFVFVLGQFFEGNILQPKLVGERVGLHPVWLMFALFAFGSLFGFTGMLIAVPAAAVIGVLARFGIGRYLESEVYRGCKSPTDRDENRIL